jgi:hypothetical protein
MYNKNQAKENNSRIEKNMKLRVRPSTDDANKYNVLISNLGG